MIWYKQGVLGRLNQPSRKALGRVASRAAVAGEDIFVTSLQEGNHMLGSLHYDGNAWDQRPLKKVSIEEVREACGSDFDVVDEGNHWHIEHDPK